MDPKLLKQARSVVTEGVKQHVTAHDVASKESALFTCGSKRCV